MTTEERTRHEVLLEDLKRDVRVIADGHAANAENLLATKTELEQRFDRVEHQIMVLDVKVNQKIDALDVKVHQISTELSRIATHLGLNGAPH